MIDQKTVAELVARDREAQGLPPQIVDQTALDNVASIVAHAKTGNRTAPKAVGHV